MWFCIHGHGCGVQSRSRRAALIVLMFLLKSCIYTKVEILVYTYYLFGWCLTASSKIFLICDYKKKTQCGVNKPRTKANGIPRPCAAYSQKTTVYHRYPGYTVCAGFWEILYTNCVVIGYTRSVDMNFLLQTVYLWEYTAYLTTGEHLSQYTKNFALVCYTHIYITQNLE